MRNGPTTTIEKSLTNVDIEVVPLKIVFECDDLWYCFKMLYQYHAPKRVKQNKCPLRVCIVLFPNENVIVGRPK